MSEDNNSYQGLTNQEKIDKFDKQAKNYPPIINSYMPGIDNSSIQGFSILASIYFNSTKALLSEAFESLKKESKFKQSKEEIISSNIESDFSKGNEKKKSYKSENLGKNSKSNEGGNTIKSENLDKKKRPNKRYSSDRRQIEKLKKKIHLNLKKDEEIDPNIEKIYQRKRDAKEREHRTEIIENIGNWSQEEGISREWKEGKKRTRKELSEEIDKLVKEHRKEIKRMRYKLDIEIEKMRAEVEGSRAEIERLKAKIKRLKDENKKLREDKILERDEVNKPYKKVLGKFIQEGKKLKQSPERKDIFKNIFKKKKTEGEPSKKFTKNDLKIIYDTIIAIQEFVETIKKRDVRKKTKINTPQINPSKTEKNNSQSPLGYQKLNQAKKNIGEKKFEDIEEDDGYY